MKIKAVGGFLFFLCALWGCTSVPVLPTAVPTLNQPSSESASPPLSNIAPATMGVSPTASPHTLSQSTNTPQATATAVSPPVIAIPQEWQHLNLDDWEIIVDGNPALLFENNVVDSALVINGEGTLIWQEPLVLAVEWTEPWESVSWEEAQFLIQNGDPRVTLMPWDEMLPTHKTLKINGRSPNDPAYPLQTRLSLLHNPNIDSGPLIASIQARLPQTQIAHVTAVGDIMLSRRLGTALQAGDINYPFFHVASHLQQADLTIGNVESALGAGGIAEDKSYNFIAPPEAAVSLANAGFDIVSLANNHGMDFGANTLLEAITQLNQQGIASIGAGKNLATATAPHIESVNGLTIAFLAYVNVPVESSGFDTQSWSATDNEAGLAWGSPEQIHQDVTAVSSQVDLIIVTLHSGYEYVPAPSPPQVAASYAAIEAGADLVIGHHAHILQGVEFYLDGVIVYGLGNFAFDINGAPETAVLDVWLDQNGVRELRLTPAIIQAGGQPRFANTIETTTIINDVYFLTKLLNR